MSSPFEGWPLYLKASDIVDITQYSRSFVYTKLMNEPGFPVIRFTNGSRSTIRVPRDKFFEWFMKREGIAPPVVEEKVPEPVATAQSRGRSRASH